MSARSSEGWVESMGGPLVAIPVSAQAPVPLPAGRWRVLAVHTQVDDGTWVGLVRLLPAGRCRRHARTDRPVRRTG